MNKQILVVYKSVTGFTKQYAEWIAEKLNCSAVELKKFPQRQCRNTKPLFSADGFMPDLWTD